MSEAPGEGARSPADRPHRRPAKTSLLQQPRVRLGAVIAVAIAVGLIIWAVVGGGSSSSPSSAPAGAGNAPANAIPLAGAGPVGMTAKRLRAFVPKFNHPVYWAGAKPGYTYELTVLQSGNIYLRYLPPGAKPGDHRSNFLIVATYPLPDALGSLQRAAKTGPGRTYSIPGGGVAWVAPSYRNSVHVAFPGVAYQVEIYHPYPPAGLAVARSGKIRPVS